MANIRAAAAVRYLTTIGLASFFIALCTMLLIEAPAGTARAASGGPVAEPQTASLGRPANLSPLPTFKAAAFDISRVVAVQAVGNPGLIERPFRAEAVTALSQLASLGVATDAAAVINADAVNVRAAPDKTSARVFVAVRGDAVSVLDTQRSWTRIVLTNGLTGWVATKFLSE